MVKKFLSFTLFLTLTLMFAPGCARIERAQSQPEVKEVVIGIKGAPFKGPKNAKIVIVEFSDFRCPWCGGYARDTFPQVEREFIDTGKAKYVFFDFPLNSTTFKIAEAANCATEQNKFWEMHDWIFANQSALDAKDLISYAEAIGVDMPKFRECVERSKYSARVAGELGQGRELGVKGTPSFFLGIAESEDKVRVVKMFWGIKSYDALKDAVERLLSSQGK